MQQKPTFTLITREIEVVVTFGEENCPQAQIYNTCSNQCIALYQFPAEGLSRSEVDEQLDISPSKVSYWIKRFAEMGFEGLQDRARAGRPASYTQEQATTIISIALTHPHHFKLPFETWTLDLLQEYLNDVEGISIKRTHIHNLLLSHGLVWNRKKGWFAHAEVLKRNSREYLNWKRMPCIFDDNLSSAVMIAESRPFHGGITDVFLDQPWPLHWHDTLEIGCILEGEGLFILEGEEYTFNPGQPFFLNEMLRHGHYSFTKSRILTMHFLPTMLDDMNSYLPDDLTGSSLKSRMQQFQPLLAADNPHAREIVRLMLAMNAEHSRKALGWTMAVKGHILQIISLYLRHFTLSESLHAGRTRHQELMTRLAPAIRLLEKNLEDPPSVGTLAASVSLSRSQFTVLFHEVMGTSPVEFRNKRRIQLAKRLLTEFTDPIHLIAQRCGFATQQQFNDLFRRIVGVSPSNYRQKTANHPPNDSA